MPDNSTYAVAGVVALVGVTLGFVGGVKVGYEVARAEVVARFTHNALASLDMGESMRILTGGKR